MRNKSLLGFIKHYWYLGILFVILMVVLVIGTQQEKPWSTNLDAPETKSSVIKGKSANVESEASSAESEDSDDASRIDSELFFLSDHQKESEESELEETESEETEASAEIKSEKTDEDDDLINDYDSNQANRTSSYTPTYSNDNYSKPKSSNSAIEKKPTTTTPSKPPAKTSVTESAELKESISVVESKPTPIEIPTVEVEVEESAESEQPEESVAPEVIESEKPIEENSSIDPSLIKE